MKLILWVVITIVLLLVLSKVVYISSLDRNFPVIGAGKTLRNIYGDKVKCPSNPVAAPRSCFSCLGNLCLVLSGD